MYDTGTTCFMIICTAMVVLMSPALALFYCGLSRRKNVVNTMLMTLMAMSIAGILWFVIGDSIAYGGQAAYDEDGNLTSFINLFFGGFDRMFTQWAVDELAGTSVELAADYPGVVSVAFQASFAMVTSAIVTGSLAGRARFGVIALVSVLWPLLVYAPMAHMTWGGGLIGETIGALDFAGGTVVHISSGVSGLILALFLGKRRGFENMNYRAHNVPFVMLGAGLLFFGWFGFNGGSALASNGAAGLAIANTLLAGCSATVCWIIIEWVKNGKPTVVGASTGLVAGLVVVTPGCGYIDPWAAIVMGFLVSPVCYWAISFAKHKFGYDDALDAFGCHGVGGILGALLVGLFADPALTPAGQAGLFYGGGLVLLGKQLLGVLATIAYVTVMVVIIALICKAVFRGSLRVSSEEESQGLDATVHGESGYPAFLGLD